MIRAQAASSRRVVGVWSAAALALACGLARAQTPVLITAPQTIAPNQATITPTAGGSPVPLAQAAITVRGTTLTVNGRHQMHALRVERNPATPTVPGVVTHAPNFSFDYSGGAGTDVVVGMHLIIADTVVVEGGSPPALAVSRIDAVGAGFPSGQGPGFPGRTTLDGAGGGHGGEGGVAATRGNQPGGAAYGSLLSPTTFGSSGGSSSSTGAVFTGGGPGGGSIRLQVGGSVTIDGVVSASGGQGQPSWWDSGGGAGGSIWISAASVVGSAGGLIEAGGGRGSSSYGGAGGGSGGRIRIESADVAGFAGTIASYGGAGNRRGAAGPIVVGPTSGPWDVRFFDVVPAQSVSPLNEPGLALELLRVGPNAGVRVDAIGTLAAMRVENGGLLRVSAPLRVLNSVEALSGSRVEPVAALTPLSITSSLIRIDSGAVVSAAGFGHPSGQGPGAGARTNGDGAGGGHGGNGGDSQRGPSNVGGSAYGNARFPETPGSGGGPSSSDGQGFGGGGAGGGVILLQAGTLIMDGELSANGTNGSSTWYDSGGGAGGSIWVVANTISGVGNITADGGVGRFGYGGGGGAGGRIAIEGDDSGFVGIVRAFGGAGFRAGGAGTVYRDSTNTMSVANGAGTTARTPLGGNVAWGLRVQNAQVEVNGGLNVAGLEVLESGLLTARALAPLSVRVRGDALIAPNGALVVDGLGFVSNEGPGRGQNGNGDGGGGGYGGRGGNGQRSPGNLGGIAYGSISNPSDFGSGGGSSIGTGVPGPTGGTGGGFVRLDVDGTLTVNGRVSANGLSGSASWWDSGAGSGGTVFVRAGAIAGSGFISADGGRGPVSYGGGGGGGGRVAVFSCNRTLPVGNITANRGLSGGAAGQAGSVYFGSGSISFTTEPIDQQVVGGTDLVVGLGAVTSNPNPQLTYQWRRRDLSGEFVAIEEGAGGGRFVGTQTATLRINASSCDDAGLYDCLVSDACGSFPSRIVSLSIVAPGDWNRDGAVDFNDFLAYLNDFNGQDPRADLDGDGVIDFNDLLAFLNLYNTPC